jgi:hypothetical protein
MIFCWLRIGLIAKTAKSSSTSHANTTSCIDLKTFPQVARVWFRLD